MNTHQEHYGLWLSRPNYLAQISFLFFLFVFLFLSFSSPTSSATTAVAMGALPGSRWATPFTFENSGVFTTILVSGGGPGPTFAFGFFKHLPSDGFLLAVFLVRTDNFSTIVRTTPPEVVWTANRDKPVSASAKLDLTASGDLRLSDGRSGMVWSTNTVGKGVASVNLTMQGNLVLLDAGRRVVWQSYDHPTDTALRGQSLTGMRLVANSSSNSSQGGIYYLSITNSSYEAYIASDQGSPPQMYYTSELSPNNQISGGILLPLKNYTNGVGNGMRRLLAVGTSNFTSPAKNGTWRPKVDNSIYAKGFVRLEADGRLREYLWLEDLSSWQPEVSLLDDNRGECGYPKACGRYGLCSGGECSCLLEDETNTDYFKAVEERKPKKGCNLVTDLRPSCGNSAAVDPQQKMVFYNDISYFGYVRKADIERVSLDLCKLTCAKNCSCKAAFLKYATNSSAGDCYLVSAVFSIIENEWTVSNYNSSAYIKVQLSVNNKNRRHRMVALTVSLICVVTLALACYILYRRRKNRIRKANKAEEEEGEEFLPFKHLPGMPTKFTYAELKDATGGFSKKLGEGGFGAVFQGTLRDGTQVAVKILGYRGQGMKEFLAEVETIGSIHHLNLVRLVGYCAERLHRLLVYEYLTNGSLENWIFQHESKGKGEPLLDLETKTKIILQVAKGLSYLHEECRQRIIHLDIKPQNILLDDNFNAKLSDFGLAKLVERDHSQVMTTMRGTPGYLAPEWLNSVITEKVDVYSFGVVVLETVSGKNILDYSRSQGSISLLHLLSKAAAEERLRDIIGADHDDEAAMRLVKIAMWCLQMDYTKRPSMSSVVKALEGVMEVETAIDFWIPPSSSMILSSSTSMSTPLLSSIVTTPR